MALFQAIFSANAAIALVGSVILCLLLVSFRHVAVDRRISQAGGQRAPILACSLFSGMSGNPPSSQAAMNYSFCIGALFNQFYSI